MNSKPVNRLRMFRLLLQGAVCVVMLWGVGEARCQVPASDPAAAALVTEAARLARDKNAAGARAKLDEAKAVNPQQAGLWTVYASLAAKEGRADEAADDLKRELANHPADVVTYRNLATLQMQQKKTADAIATIQKMLTLTPGDLLAARTLAGLQLEQKDYTGAEATLRKIAEAGPGAQADVLLSSALVHTGKKDEAHKLLAGVANSSNDPAMLNDAAYSLADEGLDLPLAEKAARHALAVLDQPSVAVTIRPLVLSEMLVSVWDTLGWTLFLEGKATEAEPWVRAAWSNGLSAETGYHLGMILEKLGQPAKAMTMYQMAVYGEPGGNQGPVLENLAARLAGMHKVGSVAPVADGKAALQALKTFRVPGANSLNGAALVELEFSGQGASSATIVKDDPKGAPLTSVETSLYGINFKTSMPTGRGARLQRRGALTCRAGKPCEFVLESTRAALAEVN